MLISALAVITMWAAYEARLRQLREAVAIGALLFCGVVSA